MSATIIPFPVKRARAPAPPLSDLASDVTRRFADATGRHMRPEVAERIARALRDAPRTR